MEELNCKTQACMARGFTRARPALPYYAPQAGHPQNGFTAILGVARQQGKRPMVIFYPPCIHHAVRPGETEVEFGLRLRSDVKNIVLF